MKLKLDVHMDNPNADAIERSGMSVLRLLAEGDGVVTYDVPPESPLNQTLQTAARQLEGLLMGARVERIEIRLGD